MIKLEYARPNPEYNYQLCINYKEHVCSSLKQLRPGSNISNGVGEELGAPCCSYVGRLLSAAVHRAHTKYGATPTRPRTRLLHLDRAGNQTHTEKSRLSV